MKQQSRVFGQNAPAPRFTPAAALLLASALSVPFAILAAFEAALHVLF